MRSTLGLVVVGLLVLGAACNGDGNSALEEQSTEYKMAVIDGDASPSDETERAYGRGLDILERYCPDERERIADMTVRSQQLLRDENIDESLLDLMQNVGLSFPEGTARGELGECADIFATYVALRVGGR